MLAHVNEGDSHCWPLMSERGPRFSPDFLFSLREAFQPHQKVIADRRTRYEGDDVDAPLRNGMVGAL